MKKGDAGYSQINNIPSVSQAKGADYSGATCWSDLTHILDRSTCPSGSSNTARCLHCAGDNCPKTRIMAFGCPPAQLLKICIRVGRPQIPASSSKWGRRPEFLYALSASLGFSAQTCACGRLCRPVCCSGSLSQQRAQALWRTLLKQCFLEDAAAAAAAASQLQICLIHWLAGLRARFPVHKPVQNWDIMSFVDVNNN